MISLTKNNQNEKTLRQMAEKFFHPYTMTAYRELTEGYFNVAYEMTLSNGDYIILKIAPSKNTRVMTYEKNIMFSEVNAMKMAAEHGGIPVPKLLGYDPGCTICESPYFFMEKLEGNSLYSVKDSLTQDQVKKIYLESGKINKKINSIVCPYFGYPGQTQFQGSNWYLVFQKLLEAGINDAVQGKVELQIPIEKIHQYLKRDQEVFEEVKSPRLVHWDCWDGNIFVTRENITGIIDWERALWADPLMEVGFRTYNDNSYFQIGYGLTNLSEKEMRRALWYDIYLTLLVSLECEYRQYETMDTYVYATELMKKQFKKIEEG